MSGAVTKSEIRRANLLTRDDQIAELMLRHRSVPIIARTLALAPEYCRKETKRVAAERGIDYQPVNDGPEDFLTAVSHRFRSNMSATIHDIRENHGHYPIEVGRLTGLSQRQQVIAKDRPFKHDYRLSELERIAKSTGKDFTKMIIIALLHGETEEEKARVRKVLACLNS